MVPIVSKLGLPVPDNEGQLHELARLPDRQMREEVEGRGGEDQGAEAGLLLMPLCSATSSVIRPRCASLRPGSGFPEALPPKKPLRPLRIARRGPAAKVSLGETNQPESDHRRMITRAEPSTNRPAPASATRSWWRSAWSISSSSSHRARRSDRHQLVSPGGGRVANWRQNRPAAAALRHRDHGAHRATVAGDQGMDPR
jgi:hypothetical protein